MRLRIVTLCIFLGLLSCQKRNWVEKPKKLIPEKQMVELLYKMALINAARNVDYTFFDKNTLDLDAMVYAQNGLDSLTFAQNVMYYASQPQVYKKILQTVENKLTQSKENLNDSTAIRALEQLKTNKNRDLENPTKQ